LIATVVSISIATTVSAATFKVRVVENEVLPGLTDGVQFLDQITITNSGLIFFGGDTFAGASDDFYYSGTLKPFSLTLAMQEGTQVIGEPGVVYVRADAVNDMNEAGEFAFVTETDPGVLDSVFKDGISIIREGDMLLGDVLNSFHHPQIDGTGATWFIADIGTDNATDKAIFRDTTLIIREGSVVDGVPISSISTSEATLGCNFRVNEAGDYIIAVDDGDAQGQDIHIILNGLNVLESGDFLLGVAQPIYWFNQNGLTATGNHWWVQASVESITSPGFAGDELVVMDGNIILIAEGDDLGDGFSVGPIQTGSVNSDGHWIYRVEATNGVTSIDTLIVDGAIVAQAGQALDANFNWGASIGFVNDIRLNDCGEIAMVTDLVPAGGGSPLESIVTGSIFDPADIDGDSDIGADDTAAFVAVLLGSAASICDERRADLNEDGFVNGLDIMPYVDVLLP
jgi:hypothetical protein